MLCEANRYDRNKSGICRVNLMSEVKIEYVLNSLYGIQYCQCCHFSYHVIFRN